MLFCVVLDDSAQLEYSQIARIFRTLWRQRKPTSSICATFGYLIMSGLRDHEKIWALLAP